MKFICKCFLSGIVILALAANTFAQTDSTGRKNLNIVFIGNSITRGVGLKDPASEAPPVEAADWLQKQPGVGTVAFKNMGFSGHTTVDFLPGGPRDFKMVEKAAAGFTNQQAQLVFSLILGTNDSAVKGPNGSPVSVHDYTINLKTIADQLLKEFAGCKLIFQQPIWYSPNTHNRGATYDAEGLARLQTYFPAIRSVVKSYRKSNPAQVFMGDTKAYEYFKKHAADDFQHEHGLEGMFYLHPNKQGAALLGDFWAKAIIKSCSESSYVIAKQGVSRNGARSNRVAL